MVKYLLTTICIVATCAMMVAAAAPLGAPVSGPGAGETADCSSLVYDLMDCMEFLVAGGNETAPDRSCCSGFKSLMEANQDCMCYAIDAASSLGLQINMTRAQVLPADCRVNSPPISSCNVSTSPSGSPAKSPTTSSPIPSPAAAPHRRFGPSPVGTPAASPVPTVGPARAPTVAPAPAMAPTSVVNGPAAAPGPVKSGANSVVSATFSAFILVILIFLF